MLLPVGRSANWTVIKISEDNLLTTVIKGSLVLASVLTVSGLLISGTSMALGIAAGSLTVLFNFVWQRSIMHRVLTLKPGRPTLYASIRYILRLSITAVILYSILVSGRFSVFGLLLGLSVVMLTIVICTILFAIQHKGD